MASFYQQPKNLFYSLPIELQRKIEIMKSHPVADIVRDNMPPKIEPFQFGASRKYAFPRPYIGPIQGQPIIEEID